MSDCLKLFYGYQTIGSMEYGTSWHLSPLKGYYLMVCLCLYMCKCARARVCLCIIFLEYEDFISRLDLFVQSILQHDLITNIINLVIGFHYLSYASCNGGHWKSESHSSLNIKHQFYKTQWGVKDFHIYKVSTWQ